MKVNNFIPLIMIAAASIAVVVFVASRSEKEPDRFSLSSNEEVSVQGVCPPFHLFTEEGDTINPWTGKNTDQPYSTRQTCGKCHDYDLITSGYHFMQGLGEDPTENQQKRIQWASSPGNYGGSWCSPAPLYRYLSDKDNDQAMVVDMSSFDFVVSCGVCHPGGGSLEHDRDGLRYDQVMLDPVNGFTSGGTNKLDGDYHKARWSESGVIEADCNLCHLPSYNNTERVKQIQQMNFKWAATAAAGFGTVEGAVAGNEEVTLAYNKASFNPDGTVEPNLVRQPRNDACLWCHAKPGYKKRGANFRDRTDVHLNAGLKCVDCHPAGMSATNELIRGKEMHQIAKGDDPGGLVRNDLDNTMLSCTECHDNGRLGAPVAKHTWLPPIHLEKIACQTCHIPERTVKSAQFVASDVFNPGTKIPSKGKHLWTFYGPDMKYWNHYGDLEMMGYDDKPTFSFSPELVKYKDVIYPVNRVHTAWPGIQSLGETALMQPRMSDIYKMWTSFFKDPESFPELQKIQDDTGDGVIEVNSPREIEALIAAVTSKLEEINYPMDGKRVVWVMNDRAYYSGNEYTEIPMEPWEASPYGNVHTYNHDIFPARSALGMNGCTDCHSYDAAFFMAPVVKYPFDHEGNTEFAPQFASLGISALQTHTGIIRESFMKPVIYFLLLGLILLSLIGAFRYFFRPAIPAKWLNSISIVLFLGFAFILLFALPDEHLSRYMLPSRFQLDANHFLIGMLLLLATFILLIARSRKAKEKFILRDVMRCSLNRFTIISFFLVVISGLLMLVSSNWIFYTLFDIGLVLIITCSILILSALTLNNSAAKIADEG